MSTIHLIVACIAASGIALAVVSVAVILYELLSDISSHTREIRNHLRYDQESVFVSNMIATLENDVPENAFVGFYCEGKEYNIRRRDFRIEGTTLISDNPFIDCVENISLCKVTKYTIYHNIQ